LRNFQTAIAAAGWFTNLFRLGLFKRVIKYHHVIERRTREDLHSQFFSHLHVCAAMEMA
jgi:hypothetical protein